MMGVLSPRVAGMLAAGAVVAARAVVAAGEVDEDSFLSEPQAASVIAPADNSAMNVMVFRRP